MALESCAFRQPDPTMELNPLYTKINDLKARLESLRGYL